MKILPQSRVKKLPNVRLSIDDINERLDKSSVSVLGYYEYPYIVYCFCTECKQYYPHKKETLLAGKICSVCANRQVVIGYNDLSTVRPDLIRYLENESDGYKYTEFSNEIIPCKCNICEYKKDIYICNLSANGFCCPRCSNKNSNIAIQGKNDIATKASWVIPYLSNPEDAYRYAWKSHSKVDFKCPFCSKIYNKSIQLVTTKGFSCPCCSDGISFPNKYIRSLLCQLPLDDLEFEYIREWTDGRFFDNYFVYEGQAYFIEVDGGQHYRDAFNTTLEVNQNIDKIKNQIAFNHNIHIIRIDCKDATAEYIKRNILNSELSVMFDLSIIDWNKCYLDALKNIVYEVCNEYSNHNLTLSEIAKKLNISYTTVKKYLKKGREIGLASKDSTFNRNYEIKKISGKKIGAVYDLNGKILFEFISLYSVSQTLNDYDKNIKSTNGSIWWCATKSNSKIYKKKYRIELYDSLAV